MTRHGLLGCLILFGVAAAPSLRAQEPSFSLGFGAPCGSTQEGDPGSAFAGTVDCRLATADNPGADGAQGWSISLGAEGALQIDNITTAGTVGAAVTDDPPGLRNTGFEKSETTAGEGNEGAVSAVVLSFVQNITLPADGEEVIAKVDVSGAFPDVENETAEGRVFYVNGRQGSGQPVNNNVTWQGNTIIPELGECQVSLFAAPPPPVCCERPISLYWQTDNIFQTGTGFDAAVESCEVFDRNHLLEVSGESASVYVGIASSEAGGLASGAQGWSLALGVSGDLDLLDVTTAGTVGDDVSMGGLRNTGFEKTEAVDPLLNEQGDGAVSAVVLSFVMNITLDMTGSATVLAFSVAPTAEPTEEMAVGGTIGPKDGLRGSGQPVANVATVGGETVGYCLSPDLDVSFIVPPVSDFVSGELNSDGRLDIADPIYLINAMFRGGPPVACPAAADVNADGEFGDVSDAVYIISYLWEGGPPPVGSFPDCGGGASLPDTGLCPSGSTVCP